MQTLLGNKSSNTFWQEVIAAYLLGYKLFKVVRYEAEGHADVVGQRPLTFYWNKVGCSTAAHLLGYKLFKVV